LAAKVDYGETSTMLRTMHWTGLLVVAGLLGGCAHTYDVCDEHMLKWRCCHDAKMAWLRCRDLYANVCNPYDFGQGFRDGYESICMGGNGCPPAMPPRTYWSTCCHSTDGNCRVMAWYDGFHHGVLAAQCDGCEGRCNILCAHDLYGQEPCEVDYDDIEVQVQPEGQFDSEYGPGYLPGNQYVPTEMPPQPLSTPPAPGVPDYSPLPSQPSPGSVRGDFGTSAQAMPSAVPGLRDMLNQNAAASEYPSF
jgi:hypothetical protein